MSHKILSVIFETDAQSHADGQFSVPAEVCRVLGDVGDRDKVHIEILTPDGVTLFSGEKALASGREIYGPEIAGCVKKGQRITVRVSHL